MLLNPQKQTKLLTRLISWFNHFLFVNWEPEFPFIEIILFHESKQDGDSQTLEQHCLEMEHILNKWGL